jgi:predicted RNA-binding Zn-ribbon protein involved in translation (DUF1610 family)
MRDALAGGAVVVAGEGAPPEAVCPACGGRVILRGRRSRDGTVWFYRHADGVGLDCLRRAWTWGR